MNNVLLIDDREDFAIQFIEHAKSKGILVAHKKSFDGLKEVLPKYQHKFVAVVLDIKCLLRDDQEKEDADFITVALSHLDANIRWFPRFILTGDDKEFESIGRYFKQEKLFKKTPEDLDKLFIKLKYCIDHSESLRIKRQNLDVFHLFSEGKMPAAAEKQLLDLFVDGLFECDFNKYKGIFANIRGIQEAMYKSIHQRAPLVVPANMFKTNGMIEFNRLMKHLNGNLDSAYQPTTIVYQNKTVNYLAQSLYWSCGEYIHDDPARTYFVSNYTVRALIYNLLELLIWSKQF
ncbi:hypothetical protein [Longitalea arenae]|uniref:hypothetical protein n=1 Tax=Longitalea arenae TaxID=2812558 RepID=UPI0019678B7F|nr:hypothetical protein [Longitalea arenae]